MLVLDRVQVPQIIFRWIASLDWLLKISQSIELEADLHYKRKPPQTSYEGM